MRTFGKTAAILTCALLLDACSMDEGMGPELPVETPPVTESFASLTLYPGDATIDIGAELQLSLIAKNSRGFIVSLPVVSYSTDAPGVLAVSASGLVKGIAPGTAHVTARATVGSATHVTSVAITVGVPKVYDGIVISAQSFGWQPQTAHITAGSVVEWRNGVIAASGRGVDTVWVTAATSTNYESLPVVNGSAFKTFNSPGTYYYCSGNCWDPPEHGQIVVH